MLNIPIPVRNALKKGVYRKNYRFNVLDDQGATDFTIDNNTLVAESVRIDERMASGRDLKFGLCEGSSLEFQYFDAENINGRKIEALLDVEYKTSNETLAWYTIPMGFFDVDSCPVQFDTGIHKVTAYNKLRSKYLDAKANQDIIDIVSQGEDGSATVSFYYILKQLLNGYNIESYDVKSVDPDITQAELDDSYEFTQWQVNHNASVIEIIVPLYTSGHASTSTYLHIVAFQCNANVGNVDEYVRSVFNAEVAKNIKQSVYQANISSHLDDRYIRSYDDSSVYVTLRNFLLNGGYATTRAVTSPQVTFDYQKRIVGGMIATYNDSKALISLTADYESPLYNILNANSQITLPFRAVINNSSTGIASQTDYATYFKLLHEEFEWIWKIQKMDVAELAKQRITLAEAKDLADVTLRELQSAVYESVCQYGQIDRVTDLFSGVELNGGGLYPQESLYPANALYPNDSLSGNAIHPFPSEYQKLWTDTVGAQNFKYLIITYKAIVDGEEVEKTLQRTVNTYGTTNYNMSDNWLFRNLVWTAEEVGAYADAMVAKMKNITWFPFEMWLAGLPYVETGDAIEITDKQGDTYISYILQRQLDGIQNLQETYVNGELDIF